MQHVISSAELLRGPGQQRTVGPPSMERFSVTENRPVPNSCPFTVARDSCLDSMQPNCSALCAACYHFGRAFARPGPTEDCWATVNGTLLGNRESSGTGQLSIHGGSRLLSRFCAAELFSVMCSVLPLRPSFCAARSQQRTVGPPLMERFSVAEKRPVPNSCPLTVARDSCLDSVQPNCSALCAAR